MTTTTEPRTVTLEMPLPPANCSPNIASGRSHWRYRHLGATQYRGEAFYVCKAAQVCPMRTPVRLCATFYTARRPHDGRYRPLDVQNGIASIKGLCDGLVDAGILPDDNARVLHWGDVRIIGARESGGRCCVVIVLTEEDA